MQAPANSGLGGVITGMPSGTTYQSNSLGIITGVQLQDVSALLSQGYGMVVSSGPENFRNLLDGGDATTNPWQRGTSFSNITGTLTYTADRWFMQGAANSSGTMAKTASTSQTTFNQSFVWGRSLSATASNTVYLGQALETLNSVRCQNENLTLSFWASAQSGWLSPTTGVNALGVQICYGTGTDQSASSLVAGTWTGFGNAVSTTQALTSTLTRYNFTGAIPSSVTQVGVLFSYTPAASALANETITMEGIQLEVVKPGLGSPTAFEHRRVGTELELCQRYYYQLNEAATGAVVAAGYAGPTNSAVFALPLPVPMRAPPTVSATVGGFGAGVLGVYTPVTSFAANTTQNTNAITVHGQVAISSGNAAFLISSGGAGVITASADL
jgi:hypothetical protein